MKADVVIVLKEGDEVRLLLEYLKSQHHCDDDWQELSLEEAVEIAQKTE